MPGTISRPSSSDARSSGGDRTGRPATARPQCRAEAGPMSYHRKVRRPDGRRRAAAYAGGKSELHRTGCRLTAGRREPTESATETIPPVLS